MARDKSPTISTGPPKAPVIPKPQLFIHNGKFLLSRTFYSAAEKTDNGLERERIFPVDGILGQLSKTKEAEQPGPRFKEWTSNFSSLKFTLAVTVPPNIVFGTFNFEKEPIQMVRCITAGILSDKYGVTCQSEEVYRTVQYWFFLVTAFHTYSLF